MRAQSDAGDDAETAAAAFQRPEEIRIGAGVGQPDVAVGGDHLGFDAGWPRPMPNCFERLPNPPPLRKPATPTVMQPPPWA